MQAAVIRKMEFEYGIFADPIFFGQFPDSVRARLPYLPEISPELVLVPNLCPFDRNAYNYSPTL